MESKEKGDIFGKRDELVRNGSFQMCFYECGEISNITAAILSKVDEKAQKTQGRLHKEIEAMISEKGGSAPHCEQKVIRRGVVAKLAEGLPERIEKQDLPESILELYPAALDRLIGYLGGSERNGYENGDEFFRKDMEFVLGLSVPCGAEVVELESNILLRTIIRSIFRIGNLGAVLRFMRTGTGGTWFRTHTESRYLADFNEVGWDAFYQRVGDLLERRKLVKGLVGTSWFYDPQLLMISPHLAYLQRRPLERGAFLIRHGSSRMDVERAILKSKTRRELYSEGKYKPISCSLIWPRESLVSWADSQRERN